ncbi:unnamed protein product [Bursaphelenchus okinawaensis]|uniref:Nucleotide-diphospho-sugar transferase domain-containing protein n=1 Tax=Bursaphelenchus okinawaensis TaxID=465554 RepID=A0A811KL70_9BILA|nr:unnamed protein product [Bursaphelenchus okinawaensis]CAG9105723.1 unnamed protein product [Bursaphelenchus okinawaensis]
MTHRIRPKLWLFSILAVSIVLFFSFDGHNIVKDGVTTLINVRSDVYVVLSADMNYHYMVALPFVVQYWYNNNVSAIVMLCGTELEFKNDKAGREVVRELERLSANIIYVKNNTINSNNFAQNMRNYAAATDFVQQNLSNDTILITSDVDFYPFHFELHIPNLDKGKEVNFYDSNCCVNQKWKNISYHQYIMITIAMTVRMWKEVMDISPLDIATTQYIEDKTNATFDYELSKHLNNKLWIWFLDQRLFGLNFYKTLKKRPELKKLVNEVKRGQRLDRNGWEKIPPKKLETVDFSKYGDAHTSPAIYTDKWWKLNLPFYRRIFPSDQLEVLIQYWANNKVNAIILLCGTREEYVNDKAAFEIIKELQKYDTHIVYVQNKILNSNNFAQTLRNFATATDFVQNNLSNDSILITSDVDFYPFHVQNHLPDLRKGKEILFHDYNCCGSQQWKDLDYRQYIMITIAMTVRVWKEIMDIRVQDTLTTEYVEEKTNATFDYELSNYLNDTWWIWFLDQRLFGLRFYRECEKNKTLNDLVSTVTRTERLDKSVWDKYDPKMLENLNLNNYDAAHTNPAILEDKWWRLNLPFYKRMYPPDQLERLIEYRNRTVQLIDMDRAKRLHYHP